MTPSHADYGLDAPKVQRNLALGGLLAGVGAMILFVTSRPSAALAPWAALSSLACLGTAAVMHWSSRIGKLSLRDRVLAEVTWRGDEHVWMLDAAGAWRWSDRRGV